MDDSEGGAIEEARMCGGVGGAVLVKAWTDDSGRGLKGRRLRWRPGGMATEEAWMGGGVGGGVSAATEGRRAMARQAINDAEANDDALLREISGYPLLTKIPTSVHRYLAIHC
ncbi:hypothetical protein GUJ93_ZPchr0012g21596 [Zizania palustris]|uniref:Uncharacterized protein n=1 Tax=Zizania palustris TaxID=103762 RepID=A0A8J5WMS6_ZIZPA|nr:hypothetical protein GUJ93_ZPchr0012g21596 [Zizania palustris]